MKLFIFQIISAFAITTFLLLSAVQCAHIPDQITNAEVNTEKTTEAATDEEISGSTQEPAVDDSSFTNTTPNLQDLEDSFGGLDFDDRYKVPEVRPPERQFGVYYLIDWNTVFDIDDQKGTRVNLRFQPKIGNPKRFFAITTP